MKCLFLIALASLNSFASDKAIYGKDDREDFYSVKTEMLREISNSVAAMIDNNRLEGSRLEGELLGRRYCSSVRFAEQPRVATCTGFLVGENLIATAAHCMSKEKCQDYSWVFDFKKESSSQAVYPLIKTNVYHCMRVKERMYSNFGAVDHAIIELDRSVENRKILDLNLTGQISASSDLVSIGFTSGLPMKFSLNGRILADHENYVETDLDTFGGNSGSPVINLSTGLVEGIVNRGHADYVPSPGSSCKVVKVCVKEGECHTSKFVKMSNVVMQL